MNRITGFIILSFLGLFNTALAQKIAAEGKALELLGKAPAEEIYVHYNSTLLFPGEYLLYKVYNLNAEDRDPSNLSQIAYVELIGEQGNRVFRHKVMLENGSGQADFFVPTSVPSGNYKLVSYTNWMKNSGHFFEGDIIIINPYQARQAALQEDIEEDLEEEIPNVGVAMNENPEDVVLQLDLAKQEYGQREKVVLNFRSGLPEVQDFSVSVRKVNDFDVTLPPAAENFVQREYPTRGDSVFLPEVRGQLFRGRIRAADSSGSTNVGGREVIVSIPSEGLIPKISRTDTKGFFFFNLDKAAIADLAVVEVAGEGRGNYQIEIRNEPGVDPAVLEFDEFFIRPGMKERIITRSVHNQIENSYFAAKPDTLIAREVERPFYKPLLESYALDDYTRFRTIPETFVEIIKSAWIRKDATGKSVFGVRGLEGNIKTDRLPLVSIDGVIVQDHQDLIGMEANKVKTISLIRDKIYLGPSVFQGAILVETIEGDYLDDNRKPYSSKVELSHPEIEKKYFQQNYDSAEGLSRIPDYRYQLLWEPRPDLHLHEKELSFFTSDVPGEYEVVVEGFTKGGQPISLRKKFRVKNSKD